MATESSILDYRVSPIGTDVEFRLCGGPLDDCKTTTEVFEAIGHAATSWARMEQHLDTILIHINKIEYSEELYDFRHPIAFSGKVKLFQKWFKRHPNLAGLSEYALEVSTRVSEISWSRNILLHSTMEEWNPNTKIAVFHNLKYNRSNDTHDSTKHDIPLDYIQQFTVVINSVNNALRHISEKLFTIDGARQLGKS